MTAPIETPAFAQPANADLGSYVRAWWARTKAGDARPGALFVVATRPLAVWAEGGESLEYRTLLARPWVSTITLGPISARACDPHTAFGPRG